MARLVRATHEHGKAGLVAVAPPRATADAEIMGGPDKPGHDELIEFST